MLLGPSSSVAIYQQLVQVRGTDRAWTQSNVSPLVCLLSFVLWVVIFAGSKPYLCLTSHSGQQVTHHFWPFLTIYAEPLSAKVTYWCHQSSLLSCTDNFVADSLFFWLIRTLWRWCALLYPRVWSAGLCSWPTWMYQGSGLETVADDVQRLWLERRRNCLVDQATNREDLLPETDWQTAMS